MAGYNNMISKSEWNELSLKIRFDQQQTDRSISTEYIL